jgi:hypothetical protein
MRHPLFWQFLATLLIVGFVLRFIWWIAAAVAVIALCWWCARAWQRHHAGVAAAARRNAEIAAPRRRGASPVDAGRRARPLRPIPAARTVR